MILVLLAVLLVLACGDNDCSTGPGCGDPLPVASTPEEFVAILDSAYDSMDLALYRSLFDSTFEFHQHRAYVEPGEPASWGFAEEMEIARRMFHGEPNLYGQRVIALDLGIGIDTFDVEAESGGAESYRVRIGVQLTVHLDTTGIWNEYSIDFVRGKGEILLRPDRRRPGHLVAVRQEDTGTYKTNPEATTERWTWGWVKQQFRYGEETPESFLDRYCRKYGASRGYSGEHVGVYDAGYQFHLRPEDVRDGCPERLDDELKYRATQRIASHWVNHKGIRARSVDLHFEPETIEPEFEVPSGRPGWETWWKVTAHYELVALLGMPSGADEEVRLSGRQVFLLHDVWPGGPLVAYRQIDGEPDGLTTIGSLGRFESMFLPETPEEFMLRFAEAYRAGSDSAYGVCLHDRFAFEAGPAESEEPPTTWDRHAETEIAERMFSGRVNAHGQSAHGIDLSVRRLEVSTTASSYPDRGPGETWHEVAGSVYLSVAIDEGDGLAPVAYLASSDHTFILCPDPSSPRRLALYRHLDPDPVAPFPVWEDPAKEAPAEEDFVELDIDGTPEDGPDHLQAELGDTIAVDCWMRGTATMGAWWILVCPSNDALEYAGAVYHLREGWTEAAPTFDYGCPMLHAQTAHSSNESGLPWLGVTLLYRTIRDDTYVTLGLDGSNSGWADASFGTGGSFADTERAEIRIGRPTTKPSSWGSTKALFR